MTLYVCICVYACVYVIVFFVFLISCQCERLSVYALINVAAAIDNNETMIDVCVVPCV